MKLEKLTTEQRSLLPKMKNKYINSYLNSDKINDDVASFCIEYYYSFIKKPCPKIYKVVDPLQAQGLANKLKGTKNTFYSFGTYLTVGWASFFAYYDTFVELGIITIEKFPKYFKLREILKSNIFLTIEFENAIIICEKPSYINRENGRLHNLDGMAIKWGSGYGQYYVNGRNISHKNFNLIKDKTYTIKDFIEEQNEEVKSTCLQYMTLKHGESYIATFFETILSETDTYINKKDDKYLKGTTNGMNVGVYTLFKGVINNHEISYVRCYCPSTDRMFYLGVDPKFINAKDAIASLYAIPSKLKPFIKSICRQGERFSTTFTDEGIKLIESKKDLGELVSISGKDYFEKMEYEF